MNMDYTPLDVRARGLSQHLCGRAELERWATLPDPTALARAMQMHGWAPLPADAGAAEIEAAERRSVAHCIGVLERWAGPDNPVLEVFHAEQERRSLRALLRGAIEGAPAAARLAGLLPTPRLPAALLAELAQARSPREVAMRLLVLGDPHAGPLAAAAGQARVDLLEVELALGRVLAQRWQHAARRGDAALRETVRQRVDLVNVQSVLELAGPAPDFEAPALFIAGGQALDRAGFVTAAAANSPAAATALLARALAGTPLAPLLARAQGDPGRLEVEALVHLIAELRRRSRTDPLSSAPVQLFLARLAAQGADIRRLAWGLALGVPAATLREGLATPWN